MYGDNREITDAVAQLDEYLGTPSFASKNEVQKFFGRVRKSISSPAMADEIAAELIDQGYIIAMRRLGYRDAPESVAFSKDYADERGISFVDAFMFGPGSAARIALADWLIEEKLHGMHRPGKGPGSAFSAETKRLWYEAECKHRGWPQADCQDGEFTPSEVPTEQRKLPQGAEEVLRDSWRRYLHKGKGYVYTGMRPLRGDQNFQMIEDMVGALLDSESRPKMFRSPLSREQQARYAAMIEEANRQCIDPFYTVYTRLFADPDALKPIWNKARRILYEYSGILREAAIDAGLIDVPVSAGITWREDNQAWQAQIPHKGTQRYLGLFRNRVDAQAAYDEAAARMGHIPGLPDVDKIWPTWEEEKARLVRMNDHPRLPIVYQQQGTHAERRYGLRPPEQLSELVERMKGVDWLAKHCLLMFDDDSPAASKDMAVRSNGEIWTRQRQAEGQRFVIQGCTSIHKDTGRIGITIYQPGFDKPSVLAEEVYHVVFGILREADPGTYRATHHWYERSLKNGADPTISLDEAFSKSMALEESGLVTDLPRYVVKRARRIFSNASNVADVAMTRSKGR